MRRVGISSSVEVVIPPIYYRFARFLLPSALSAPTERFPASLLSHFLNHHHSSLFLTSESTGAPLLATAGITPERVRPPSSLLLCHGVSIPAIG